MERKIVQTIFMMFTCMDKQSDLADFRIAPVSDLITTEKSVLQRKLKINVGNQVIFNSTLCIECQTHPVLATAVTGKTLSSG